MPTSESCALVSRFVGGELSPEDTRAFQLHLAGCAQCQKELAVLLQIDGLAEFGLRHGPLQPNANPRWSPRTAVVSAVVTLAVVALLLTIYRGPLLLQLVPTPGAEVALKRVWAPVRGNASLPRTTHLEADQFRPGTRQLGPGTHAGPFPRDEFDQLERKNDPLEIAAALLLWGRADEANERLKDALKPGVAESDDYWNTQAAIYIEQSRFQEALPLLAKVLERNPTLSQAHWNRALALEGLGLTLSANREYEEVERAEPMGSDWALEARRRAARHSEDAGRWIRWKKVLKAGEDLIEAGVSPDPSLELSKYAIARLYFYDALRTRQSAEDVRLLLPLARALDPTGVLSSDVDRVASRDFSKRAPLARQYKEIWKDINSGAGITEQHWGTVPGLLSSGEADIAAGTVILLPKDRQDLQLLEGLAAKLNDPWFEVLVRQRRAAVAQSSGDALEAEKWLGQALTFCRGGDIPYRCIDAKFDMASVQSSLLEMDEAQKNAMEGRTLALDGEEAGKGVQLTELIAQLARLRNDIPVARAFLDEAVMMAQDDKPSQHHIHQALASLALQELDFTRARREIDLALATGLPLTLAGAMDLADITRHLPTKGDKESLRRAMEQARHEKISAGQQALWKHVRGRFSLSVQEDLGRDYLQEVLRDVQQRSPQEQKRDQDLQRARAVSYNELILDDGRRGDFSAALGLLAEEQGFQAPARCAVAMAEETERSLLLVRGAEGEIWGHFEGDGRRPLPRDMKDVLPAEAVSTLRGCQQVEVIARPPLYDRRNLLPPEMAWSYRMRPQPLPPRAEGGRYLVVSDVEYREDRVDEKLNLPRWTPASEPSNELVLLKGREATPEHVLQAMADATEVDLVTHGNTAQASSSSFLVLAPERSGEDRLTVARIRQSEDLKHAPFVVIAACEGGLASPIYHEAVSLPAMLLRKGARGVLAATVKIPDSEVNEFINEVRARMQQGALPAVALRDVRQRWLSMGKSADWIDHILLFE